MSSQTGGKNRSVGAVSYLDFNLTPTAGSAVGRLMWNSIDGTLEFGMAGGVVVQQVGAEGLIKVKGKEVGGLVDGNLVYISGASGDNVEVMLGDNRDVDKSFLLGMVTEPIALNGFGFVTLWGKIRGLDTLGMGEGTRLYLGEDGGYIITPPSSPVTAVVAVGQVTRDHAVNGEITITDFQYFSIGNDHDATLRSSIINKNDGTSAGTGFSTVNDAGHFATFGIGGSLNGVFPDVTVFYGMGYNDNWYAVDGNKSHRWFNDPTDSHNNSSLDYENMSLDPDGTLNLPRATGVQAGGGELQVGNETVNKLAARHANTVLESNTTQIENLLLWSEKFDEAVWTAGTGVNVAETAGGGSYTITGPTVPTPSDFSFLQYTGIPDTDAKLLTVRITCKGMGSLRADPQFGIYLMDGSTNLFDADGGAAAPWFTRIEDEEFVTITRVANAVATSDVTLSIRNPALTPDFEMIIVKVEVYTTLPYAILSAGDSLAYASAWGAGQSYTQLYAEKYQCDFKRISYPGYKLADILTALEAEVSAGNRYPAVFMEGGGNDIGDDETALSMINQVPDIVAALLALSNNIAWLNVSVAPAWIGDASKLLQVGLFNTALASVLAPYSFITLVDVNSVLDNSAGSPDYTDFDWVHWNKYGDAKVFNLINESVDFPYYADIHKYKKNTNANYPAVDPGLTEGYKRNIDWTDATENLHTDGVVHGDIMTTNELTAATIKAISIGGIAPLDLFIASVTGKGIALGMGDAAGATAVIFTNDSPTQVAKIDSLGLATFSGVDVGFGTVTALILQPPTGQHLFINCRPNKGAGVTLGDALGAQSFTINSNAANVAKIDSLGRATFTEVHAPSGQDLPVTCDAGKTLKLTAPVWNDIQFPILAGLLVGTGNPSPEDMTDGTTTLDYQGYAFSDGEQLDLPANELDHKYQEGENGQPHAHIVIKNPPTGDDYVKIEIVVSHRDKTTRIWGSTVHSGEILIPSGSSGLEEFYVPMTPDIDLSGLTLGTQVGVRVKRITAAGAAYAPDAYITQCGIHVPDDTMGSRQPGVK